MPVYKVEVDKFARLAFLGKVSSVIPSSLHFHFQSKEPLNSMH